MLFSSWLRNCKSSLEHRAALRRIKRPKPAGRRLVSRLVLEALEDRTLLSTYLVTNTGDNGGVNPAPGAGTGTLRQAIVDANYYNTGTAVNPDQIQFNIPTTDPGYHAPAASVGITSASVSANVATLTTSSPVPFTVGQTVTVAGLSNSFFNGDYQITAVTANSFSYALVHADLASTADTGTASDPSWFTINTTGLPAITNPVNLNGYSQSGASPNTHPMGGADPSDNAVREIVLDGALGINGANSTIQGLVFDGPVSEAINIEGSGNVIEGNFFDASVGVGVAIGVASNNNTIGGTVAGARNIIAGSDYGIYMQGGAYNPATDNLVEGNYIGIDSTGKAVVSGLGYSGVALVHGNGGNIIGGATPSARNAISGWQSSQVDLSQRYIGIENGIPVAGPDTVEGNYIGTDATGTVDFVTNPASLHGTGVAGSLNEVIANNLISGLATAIESGGQETIQGNKIGTDASGTKPLPNGVGVSSSSNDLIGGTTPGAGNIIAFNDGTAVNADGGDTIQGNSIFNNAGPGVWVYGTGNAIQGNSIFNNTGPAVSVLGTGDPIEGNSIYGNGGPAIDNLSQYGDNLLPPLIDTNVAGGPFTGTDNSTITGLTLTQTGSTLTYNNGTLSGLSNTRYLVTLNATSPDGTYWGSYYIFLTTDGSGQASISNLSYQAPSGFPTTQGTWTGNAQTYVAHSPSLGNYEQNYPVLSSVSSSAGDTSISGTLNGQANTTFRIEFFSNPSEDPSGYGQGQTYLGYANVTTDANGNVTFTTDLAVGNLAGQWITATATDPNGNTSEFSADFQATAAPSQTYAQYLQAAVPQSTSTANSMTIYASSSVSPNTVINAVNGLTNITQPVLIILDLGGGTYSSGGAVANPPPNVTFQVQDGTLDPDYPALTVAGGQVEISHCTLTTTGNAPTLLITGGNVILRNDVVQSSTYLGDPAIALTGGTLDLGTTASPGNNTINANGSGQLIQNTTGNPIAATGDTFESNNTLLSPTASLSFSSLTSSATPDTYGQALTLTATVQGNGSSTSLTGSVDFFDTTTNTDLGSVALSGGVATLTTSTLAAGTHVIQATYSGDSNFLGSSATLTQGVNKAQPYFSLVTPPAVIAGTANTQITGAIAAGSLIPPGSVTVTVNGNTQTATINPTDGSFAVSVPTASLGTGSYTIVYNYAGSSNFYATTGTATMSVANGILALFDQDHAKQAGSTIPIQIELVSSSGQDLSSASTTVTAQGMAATTDTTDNVGSIDPSAVGTLQPVQSSGNANPNNVFSLQGGSKPFYQFNLQTPTGLTAGTYRLYFSVSNDPLWHWVTFSIA